MKQGVGLENTTQPTVTANRFSCRDLSLH